MIRAMQEEKNQAAAEGRQNITSNADVARAPPPALRPHHQLRSDSRPRLSSRAKLGSDRL